MAHTQYRAPASDVASHEVPRRTIEHTLAGVEIRAELETFPFCYWLQSGFHVEAQGRHFFPRPDRFEVLQTRTEFWVLQGGAVREGAIYSLGPLLLAKLRYRIELEGSPSEQGVARFRSLRATSAWLAVGLALSLAAFGALIVFMVILRLLSPDAV